MLWAVLPRTRFCPHEPPNALAAGLTTTALEQTGRLPRPGFISRSLFRESCTLTELCCVPHINTTVMEAGVGPVQCHPALDHRGPPAPIIILRPSPSNSQPVLRLITR